MEWLSKVAKHHKEYVRWVNKWGEYDFAEDLVQEMYLRLHQYSSESKFIEDDIVNKYYVYRTLWNMYQNFLADKKRIEKIRIGDGFEVTYENTDEQEARSYNVLCDRMYEAIDKLHWYDGMMFEVVSCSDSSIHQFAKDSGIGFWSVYNTIRKARKEIKEIIGEDYEDFLHSDYERIKD